MKMDLEWEENDKSVDKTTKKATKFVNRNLTPDQMRETLDKYEAKYPAYDLEPLIIKGLRKNKSRFYIIRSLTGNDDEKLDDLISMYETKEITQYRAKAKDLWFKENEKDKDTALSNEDISTMEEYVSNFLKYNGDAISKKINNIVMNKIAVIFPESHSDDISNVIVPPGDIVLLASSVQVLSGWSEVNYDIDVYQKEEEARNKEEEELYSTFDDE